MRRTIWIVSLLLTLAAAPAHSGELLEKFAVLASFAAIDYDQSAGWVTPGGGAWN